jgi:hypothetical protein
MTQPTRRWRVARPTVTVVLLIVVLLSVAPRWANDDRNPPALGVQSALAQHEDMVSGDDTEFSAGDTADDSQPADFEDSSDMSDAGAPAAVAPTDVAPTSTQDVPGPAVPQPPQPVPTREARMSLIRPWQVCRPNPPSLTRVIADLKMGDNHYYLPNRTVAPNVCATSGAACLAVVDANMGTLVATVPLPAGAGSHAVAAGPCNNEVFVPVQDQVGYYQGVAVITIVP